MKHRGPISNIFRFMLHLAAAFAGVSMLFLFFGSIYLQSLLPLISSAIEHTSPSYEVLEAKTVNVNSIKQIHYTIRTHHPFVDAEGKKWPASDQTVGIHGLSIYILPIVTFSFLLAWPPLEKKKKALAVLVAIPLIMALEVIDIPVFLLYTLKESYINASLHVPVEIAWYHEFLYDFFNTGGRQFLAILVFIASVAPFHIIGVKKMDSGTFG